LLAGPGQSQNISGHVPDAPKMPAEWYIGFHGGGGKGEHNNIHIYSQKGEELGKALDVDNIPANVKLRELRDFRFGPDKNLYVVNAYVERSAVLRFRGKRNKHGKHEFMDVFLEHDTAKNPGLLHPFNLAFGTDGSVLVSSQDTNIVSRYHGPKDSHPGEPFSIPAQWGKAPDLPPGTFIPSAKDFDDGIMQVREAIFGPDGHFYVADRDGDCVRKYDGKSAAPLGRVVTHTDNLDKPIHLLFDGHNLYIGSGGNDSILKHDLTLQKTVVFVAPGSGGLKAPAGMAVDQEGFLYVASRESKEILRYNSRGKPDRNPFMDDLTDHPEFMRLVDIS
jgi:hypothetical protein